jgi:hypothetical protein
VGDVGRDNSSKTARLSHGVGTASFYRGCTVPFDWQAFFKQQIEECRELENQAVNAEDRAFWRQAGARWEEQFRQAREAETRMAKAKRVQNADA